MILLLNRALHLFPRGYLARQLKYTYFAKIFGRLWSEDGISQFLDDEKDAIFIFSIPVTFPIFR